MEYKIENNILQWKRSLCRII